MEIQDIKIAAREEIEETFKDGHCPKCKGTTTMMRVYFQPDVECDLSPEPKLVRCMKCLTLFSLELVDQG